MAPLVGAARTVVTPADETVNSCPLLPIIQAGADDPYGGLDLYSDQKAYFAQCAVTDLYDVEVSSFDGSRGRDGRVILPEAT